MIKALLVSAAFAFRLTASAEAQDTENEPAPSPNEIVDTAPQADWVRIASEDIVVMTLTPDPTGNERKVVIQLMPAPFSQGWVENIRTLARAGWYDGTSVNRVQDNYVVQWGDPNHDNPEADGEGKPLPNGLNVMGEAEYTVPSIMLIDDPQGSPRINYSLGFVLMRNAIIAAQGGPEIPANVAEALTKNPKKVQSNEVPRPRMGDQYSPFATLARGWALGADMTKDGKGSNRFWPVHCYGMVGVGRNYSPDTGSGAELYTVIGHAPRHLDRNIALVGRIVSGMEHLSSLPRGSGALGFYTAEEKDKRVPILSIRVASDLSEAEQPRFEYLSTETESFARYAEARANRRDPFFIHPAGGADICNIPVPIRTSTDASSEEG